MEAVEIIAHRGSSFLAPENTLAAVHLAWQEGADAVEGDFRLAADGHIVCIHDATLKRTAGVDRPVAECSLKELKLYDVGSWKGPQYATERIPTLPEVLAATPTGKRVYVELKGGEEIVAPLAKLATNGTIELDKHVVLISLNTEIIRKLKTSIPHCTAYWVVEYRRSPGGGWVPTIDDMLRTAHSIACDGLDLMATGPIDADLTREASNQGLALCAWTVDDPKLARG